MEEFRREFIEYAVARNVIRFGDFKTKAGRASPYFFNTGLFNDGASLARLGQFYAKAITAAAVSFDMLFGPAYKGIVLVTAVAIALAACGVDVPFAFNRKEVKDHGEGGLIVGAPLKGRVLIVDDVISAGTSVRESVDLIRAHGAVPAGVAISLDRMERGLESSQSAAQEVEANFAIPVLSIATLDDLLSYLRDSSLAAELARVEAYRKAYGVSASMQGKNVNA